MRVGYVGLARKDQRFALLHGAADAADGWSKTYERFLK
jgi:hypothetical protein